MNELGAEKTINESSTAAEKLESLKKDFESELLKLEDTGKDLLAKHPRYETQAREMIEIARRKRDECNSNMFSMSLAAEFQTGKSTTVNAMVEGHVICPSGNGGGGIRTSSCAVKVKYGESLPKVIWKSKETLDQDLQYWTGGVVNLSLSPNELNKVLDNIAKNADSIFNAKTEDKDEVLIDKLHQTLLFMSYYDHSQVLDWLNNDTLPVEKVLEFLAFPTDNSIYWSKIHDEIKKLKNPTQNKIRGIIRNYFTPENAMYLFIEIVNFSTPSEYLRAMGITIIDTPGLNMSNNDTNIALACMSESTSIFYIFNDEKQLADDDKNALKLIAQAGCKEKVFFGINFRHSIAQLENMEEANLADLKQLGYTSPHQQRFLRFNAFLAQRAQQGKLILNNNLQPNDKAKIIEEALTGITDETEREEKRREYELDITQAWIETTAKVMADLENNIKQTMEILKKFDQLGLCGDTIKLVEKASHWEETVNSILDYVMKNRSRIILNDRVATPIENQLEAIEKILQLDEKDSTQNAEELKKKYEVAKKRYKDFQDECNVKVGERIKEDWDYKIAKDFYENVYEKCPAPTAAAAAGRIQKQQTFLNNVGYLATNMLNKVKGFFDMDKAQSELEKQCALIMQESLENATTPLSMAWIGNFENSTVYQSTIRIPVDRLHEDIANIWDKHGFGNDEILKDLLEILKGKLPKGVFSIDSENIVLSDESLSKVLDQNVEIGGSAKDTLKGAITGLLGATGVAYIYLFILPVDFIVPFAAEILALVMVAIAALVKKFAGKNREEKDRKKLQKDLEHELTTAFFNQEKRNEIIQKLIDGDISADPISAVPISAVPSKSTDKKFRNPGLKIYRLFYQTAFEEAIKSCGRLLEDKAAQAAADAKKGDDERKLIADEAKAIREGVIAELKKGISDLKQRVNELYPETSI